MARMNSAELKEAVFDFPVYFSIHQNIKLHVWSYSY